MSVKIHTQKDAAWRNADGDNVPVKFVPVMDKKKEALAGKLHKSALSLEAALAGLHKTMSDAFAEIKEMVREEYSLKYKKPMKEKGSITWFNFDRSLKIEADKNDIVKWDNALMTAAKDQLDAYLNSNLSETNELISALVSGAFANTRGMIDSGKVFQILKYQDKIRDKRFQKACELMKNAQSLDKTKLYMRIWERQTDGQYRNINLNFSSL